MGLFGNRQVLCILSRVLTSFMYQNGYFKRIVVVPKFRLYWVQKRGKKEQKMKKMRFAKKTFLVLRVRELGIVLGVNTDRKNRVRKVCSTKIFFDFFLPVKVRNFGNFVIKYLKAYGFFGDENFWYTDRPQFSILTQILWGSY